MNKKNINIKSYDGSDAFYTGTDEDYEEFLKSADIDPDDIEAAEPVDNTQKINLADTINIQSVIDRFKRTAGDLRDTFTMKMENVRTKKEEKSEAAEAEPKAETANAEAEAVKAGTEKIEARETHAPQLPDFKKDFTDVTDRVDAVSKKLEEITEKLNILEIKDTQRMGDNERNHSDMKRSLNEISANIADIKQSLGSVTKLNDSVFDLKNTQLNTKKTISDMGVSFTRLKKKCVLGITVLSILSAIIIALEVILMLS